MKKQTKKAKIEEKDKKKEIVSVRFCPNCGGQDIVMTLGGITGMFECVKCGFESPVFPEREVEVDEK